jgi:hypothetical protein
LGVTRTEDLDHRSIYGDLAGVPRHRATDDFHQRGFARAVFAEQHVDFAGHQVQVHTVERDNAGVTFPNSAQRQHRRSGSG